MIHNLLHVFKLKWFSFFPQNYAPQVSFFYTTITLGVDPGYISQVFYNKILHNDTKRVMERFENANHRQVLLMSSFKKNEMKNLLNILLFTQITVREASVSINEILSHLANHGTCIVLTNANLLTCDSCNYFDFCRKANSAAANCLSLRACNDSYQGHYVVVVGFDLPRRKVRLIFFLSWTIFY